ncbi:MAG: 2-oxo acid dehydrogenase subunit E2, partial [Spirochaetales bacterium]
MPLNWRYSRASRRSSPRPPVRCTWRCPVAEPILMTALSPTMNDGVIAEWIAKEGQAVKPGDALCEVETDKATMTYESPSAGTLLAIVKQAGSSALVGELIAVLGKPGEDWSTLVTAARPMEQTGASLPELGPSQPKVPEPSGGTAADAKANQLPASRPFSSSPSPAAMVDGGPSAPTGYPPSSPLARSLARERNVDIRGIRGSGPSGRVVARDIPAVEASVNPAPRPTVALAASRGRLRDERVPVSRMRAIIARRLSASYSEAPHFFMRAAVDMERLLDLRAGANAKREQPLSLNAFIMKIVAAALEQHPTVNASWEGDIIRYKPSADIGLAVALEGGLITPVVRACEGKGIKAIDAELSDLVARARAGTLAPEEYSEASFTVSNLGS